ncbi:zinc-dependent peptidase [Sporocytophaga myxococcoides]|uniref:zinc-dependent peptidase n=1 Tax=Sporocytophaga myxococcoides TaxID=153721 RepID=UPI000421A3B3|nr:zinc-dependent peptidase [Sporocytophaga myxococcoides]
MVLAALFIIIFLITTCIFLYETIGGKILSLGEWILTRFVKLNPVQIHILEFNFRYYQKLSSENKLKFQRRVKFFLLNKKFYPQGGMNITEEMKIMIGACFVQLTFGLRPVKLRHFSRFYIYPTRYFSKITNLHHVGEVQTDGAIVLSWQHFQKGYEIPDDGLNVGLHEMAHAVKLADMYDDDDDFEGNSLFDYKDLVRFFKIGKTEINEIKKDKTHFIRKYAATNIEELFAVSVEYFFEKPEEFRVEVPQLYQILVQLLRQDPANSHPTAFKESKKKKSAN